MKQKTIFGHPAGLFVLFFTEMWERFSYYGMRAILLMFLIDKGSGGLGFSEGEGGAVYGLYTASAYLLALPGGYLADKVIGQRKAIWIGGIVIMLGHIILAIPGSELIFFLGLGTVALGTGLLKPNISSIVSELYPEGGARRDAAFSIFYVGINTGSFLGITIVGYLGQKVGWHYGFAAAAVAMFLGLVVYKIYGEAYLGQLGIAPKGREETQEVSTGNPLLSKIFMGIFGAAIIFLFYNGTLNFADKQSTATSMGIIIAMVVIVYFANILFASGITAEERKKVWLLVVLFLGATLFWAGFEQQGSTFQIFAERYSELPFGMPSSWFQNFNSIFILIFAPVVGAFWVFLEKRKIEIAPSVKFAVALILVAVGYLIMAGGARVALTGVKASAAFLTFTYLFHTLGEVCLSPVGLSSFTKLAPKQFLSQLMGVWFVATSLGNLIAGLFAGNFDEENVGQMPEMFMSIVWFCIAVAIPILLFSKPLKKLMGGVK